MILIDHKINKSINNRRIKNRKINNDNLIKKI